MMVLKLWMMSKMKMMMSAMVKYLEIQLVNHKDQKDLGLVVDLKDPKGHKTSGPCLHDLDCQMPNNFSKR